MSKFLCDNCNQAKAILKRPKNQQPTCVECFYKNFEEEIHQTIIKNKLFSPGDRIAIGTSGGKDSTVVVHIMNKLNKKYNYGVELIMVAVDEGIKGYRDDSLEAVKRNQKVEELELLIISYK